MYKITTRTKNVDKQYGRFVDEKIQAKLEILKQNPRSKLGAHQLKGKLRGKWSCWLGSKIRIVYEIDDSNKLIIIEAIGTHKIYF